MANRQTILQELRDLNSDLAQIPTTINFNVPAGYFDRLPAEIMKRIKALESSDAKEELESLSPLLGSISRKMPFTTPEGYFEELGEKLQQAVPGHTGENEAEPRILMGLKDKSTYGVPAGYFENFAALMAKRVRAQEAKLVPITSRQWFRYAAAAVIIGFVATMGFFILNRNEVDPSAKSYAWVKKNLKKVSNDDINEFVELANAATPDLVKLDTKTEISNLLKDVSDKEIQEFLDDTQAVEPAAETADDLLILN